MYEHSPTSVAERPTVLILLGAMWPDNDSSGPNQSVKRMCEALADDFNFKIMARTGAPGELVNAAVPTGWVDRGFAQVRYLPVRHGTAWGLVRAVRETPHDALILNSVWDREFTLPMLAARRTGLLRRTPGLLSTHGEFSDQALNLKPGRKRLLRRILSASGVLRDLKLQVSTDLEEADVRRSFPRMPIFNAGNAMPLPPMVPHAPRDPAQALRALFVGRISPVKGLDLALEALARVTAPVDFRICGPVMDAHYWQRCRSLIAGLPRNVTVKVMGETDSAGVTEALGAADILLLPSHSENFGHAIFEALAAGVPPVIGANTPWRELESKHAGITVPTGDPALWAGAIEQMARLETQAFASWRAGARAIAATYVEHSPAAEQWRSQLRALARGDGEMPS